MLTLVSKDSVKISDHFDVLCVLIACMVLEIINQMSKNQKSSLIVWNTVCMVINFRSMVKLGETQGKTLLFARSLWVFHNFNFVQIIMVVSNS